MLDVLRGKGASEKVVVFSEYKALLQVGVTAGVSCWDAGK